MNQFDPQSTSVSVLSLAYVAWVVGAVVGVAGGKRVPDRLHSLFLLVGGLYVIGAVILTWGKQHLWRIAEPLEVAFTPLAGYIDSLSAIFLLLLGTITLVVSLYLPGYLARTTRTIHKGLFWTFVNLFILAMSQVILSANAITLLVFWELMSISGAALLLIEHHRRSARRASLIYFGASTVSAGFLIGGFIWMRVVSGSWYFNNWNFGTTILEIPATLIVVGIAVKAGLWPFHVWMPQVYSEALPPVSALLSGVKLQVAIYLLLRILIATAGINETFAYALVAIGTISALWGILFALVQNDLKVLLAYSSVENVGLAVVGIGLTILARKHNLNEVASIALLGTIFHCINHGIYKSLLFFNVGSIETSTGSTNLGLLGGLSNRMPWTLVTFFVGTLAIASLPPLNGFSSKWLYYQSLLQFSYKSPSVPDNICSFAIIAILSLVGAMSIACFAKALGIAFLGRPRSKFLKEAHEVPPGMLMAQGALAVGCIVLGLCAPGVLYLCGPVISSCGLPTVHHLYPFAIDKIAIVGLILMGLMYCILTPKSSPKHRQFDTWDCGYGTLPARAEESGSSFSEPIALLFRPLLQFKVTNKIEGKDRRHFPEHINVETSIVPVLEQYLYKPFLTAANTFNRTLVKVQTGSIHIHLLYVFLTALCLIWLGAKK